METIEKIDVKKMKIDIKKMVEEQKFYKSERKNGKTMRPSEAQWKHSAMRKRLRIMYAAYGVARGKSFSQVEKHYENCDPHPLQQYLSQINGIIDKYKIEVPIEIKEGV